MGRKILQKKLKNEIIKNIDFKLYGARKIDKYIKDGFLTSEFVKNNTDILKKDKYLLLIKSEVIDVRITSINPQI